MNEQIMKKIQEIFEEQGWGWSEYKGDYNISYVTPNCGDFNMDIDGESFLSDFESQAQEFDVTDYVKFWLTENRTNLNVYELLEDAEAIQKELTTIQKALDKLTEE